MYETTKMSLQQHIKMGKACEAAFTAIIKEIDGINSTADFEIMMITAIRLMCTIAVTVPETNFD